MKTLRGRLLRTLTAMLVLLFLAEWVVLGVAIRQVSESQMLMHLEHDGEALLAALELPAGAAPRVDPHAVEVVYQRPASGHYYVIGVERGPAVPSASLAGFPLAMQSVAPGQSTSYHASGPEGQSLIVFAQSSQVEGRPVTVHVAEDVSDTNRQIARLSIASVAVFLPLLAVALLVQGMAVRRSLQPLVDIRDRLRDVGAGRHAQITGDVPLEIQPLVAELNRLLALIEARLHRSRTALGNLAHALKTPLAVLFRLGEDSAIATAQRDVLRAQAGSIRERLERELRRARIAGPSSGAAGAFFNPAAELPALLKALGVVYRDKDIDFDVDALDRLLPFDREDMLELAGNLADNACKWAHARVRMAVREIDGAVRFDVADDGPGCEAQGLEALGARGMRMDESVAGHGLGLAIVRDIVDFYGGTLTFGSDERLGGLHVAVMLPAPAAAQA